MELKLPLSLVEEREEQEAPIITYLNRLQKQMFIITSMLSNHDTSFTYLAAPIRMLIYNLPPKGRETLKEETRKLEDFEMNINEISSRTEMEQIYKTVHEWAYVNLFQDAFKMRPRAKTPGNL